MKNIRVYQNTIYIQNDRYSNGVAHFGTNRHPNIGVEYEYLQYCDNMLHDSFWVDTNNLRQSFNDSQINILDEIVSSWEQELGQEGNPTLKQAREFKLGELNNSFNLSVAKITTALPHEMTSWRKQEEQARAYLVDNTVATPFIDVLMVTRNFGETKDELVAKIIANADEYDIAYASLLGKFQNLSKAIDYCTTVKEVEAISW